MLGHDFPTTQRTVASSALRLAFGIGLCLVSSLARASDAPAPDWVGPMSRPYSLRGTEQVEVTSRAGRPYRIFLAHPLAEAPPEGFPVLYILDANACFASAVEMHRILTQRGVDGGLSPAVLVGIGYPTDELFDRVRRVYDFTTPADPEKLPPTRIPGGWPRSGGADEFREFILQELMPLVEAKFPINKKRQAIFGHSLGGLFVLHTMRTRPDAFQAYIASSPAVWWNDYEIVAPLEEFWREPAELHEPVRLLMTVGGKELTEDRGPAAALAPTAAKKQFGNLQTFAQGLVNRPSPTCSAQWQVIPDESHGSVLPISVGRALRFALVSSAPFNARALSP